jgi:PAS domain S-box-containing protein
VFGYSPQEILGENIEILIPTEEFSAVWQRIINNTREGGMFKEEIAIINKNRVRQHLQLATSLITDSKGKSDRLLFVAECVLPPQTGDYV